MADGEEEPALGSLTDLCQSLLSTFRSKKSGNDQGLHLGEESLASSRGNKGQGFKRATGTVGQEAAAPLGGPTATPLTLCVLGWGRLLPGGVSISF